MKVLEGAKDRRDQKYKFWKELWRRESKYISRDHYLFIYSVNRLDFYPSRSQQHCVLYHVGLSALIIFHWLVKTLTNHLGPISNIFKETSTNRSVKMLQLHNHFNEGQWHMKKGRKTLPCWIHYKAHKDAHNLPTSNVYWKVSDARTEISN